MATANVWTYTIEHKSMVKHFARVNNFGIFENSIHGLTEDKKEYCMLSFSGSKNNLRLIAAYALALQHTLDSTAYYALSDTLDIID